MLKTIHKNIEKNLQQFIVKRLKFYQLDKIHQPFYNHLIEYTLRQGKRVRPTLLVLAYKGYHSKSKPISKTIFQAAASIELLHNFMLIHDDIIDCSDLRRGKLTLHKLLEKIAPSNNPSTLGTSLGIVAGDLLYAIAVEALLSVNEDKYRKEKALQFFTQTTAYTAIGEIIDTIFGFEPLSKITEEAVYLNYTLKTSRYTFEGPLIIGAALAGAPTSEIKLLSQLSMLAGQAFQIQDDVIGIFGTEKNIGKSILSDLNESKKTLLIWRAINQLKGKEKKRFIQIFTKAHKNIVDLNEVREIFVNNGTLEYCLTATRLRLNQALKILKTLSMDTAILEAIKQVIANPFRESHLIAQENNLTF